MTYSFLVHNGDFGAKNVVRPAYELNIPAVAAKGTASVDPLLSVDADDIICETVKPAEDGTGDIILRLYECEGRRSGAKLAFGIPVKGVFLTDMLEDGGEAVSLDGNSCALSFRPFEIKTVRVKR